MRIASIGQLFSEIKDLFVREVVNAPIWEVISTSTTLNSEFVTALIGSLVGAGFGAWAGAYAAQKIATRARLKEEVQREIRGTNEAISVAFAICQSALRLKVSGVLDLRLRFDQTLAELELFDEARRRGALRNGETFRFLADLETITPFPIPSNVLQTLVFEKISVLGRPHQLALQIGQTWHSLSEAIICRNQLIDEFRARWPNGSLPPHIYFGLPDNDGNIDARYATALDGIYRQTDDCIAFSKMLCEDLQRHGEAIRKVCVKRFGKKSAPRITDFSFAAAAARGLLPPPRNYQDWETMFVIRPPEPTLVGRIVTSGAKLGRRSVVALRLIGIALAKIVRWFVGKFRRLYFALSFLTTWTP